MFLETNNFEFGEFHLDAREKVLLRDGKPLPITPKAFQLLFILVENHGHLVEKDELMKSVPARTLTYKIKTQTVWRDSRKLVSACRVDGRAHILRGAKN